MSPSLAEVCSYFFTIFWTELVDIAYNGIVVSSKVRAQLGYSQLQQQKSTVLIPSTSFVANVLFSCGKSFADTSLLPSSSILRAAK